jgi:hypothetical protein
MDTRTKKLKDEALATIGRLFSNERALERDQIAAMEEIESLCSDNITALREQLRMTESEGQRSW